MGRGRGGDRPGFTSSCSSRLRRTASCTDWLAAHGEGVHHVGYWAPSIEVAQSLLRQLTEDGTEVLLSAWIDDVSFLLSRHSPDDLRGLGLGTLIPYSPCDDRVTEWMGPRKPYDICPADRRFAARPGTRGAPTAASTTNAHGRLVDERPDDDRDDQPTGVADQQQDPGRDATGRAHPPLDRSSITGSAASSTKPIARDHDVVGTTNGEARRARGGSRHTPRTAPARYRRSARRAGAPRAGQRRTRPSRR